MELVGGQGPSRPAVHSLLLACFLVVARFPRCSSFQMMSPLSASSKVSVVQTQRSQNLLHLGSRSNIFSDRRVSKRSSFSTAMQQKPSDALPQLEAASELLKDNQRAFSFSAAMTFCGAALGPCLDNYHSAFGVLAYDNPIKLIVGGDTWLTTAIWVPPLFGLAGFIIGWLYVLLDAIFRTSSELQKPSGPKILNGIAFFTLQYWLSGFLADAGMEGGPLFGVLSVLATLGFVAFDNNRAGFLTSLATAVGGPLIEIGLITSLAKGSGYHYTAPDFLDVIPLWICPVYFLGGPAVGNLARGIWNALSGEDAEDARLGNAEEECEFCKGTRAVPCPNCDGQGSYVTYNRNVRCTSCSGRGFVVCRACFGRYGDDPWDIDAIRSKMDSEDVRARVDREKRRKFLL